MAEKMKSWWNKRSKSDRFLIIICLITTIIFGYKEYSDRQANVTPEVSLSQAVKLSQVNTFSRAVIQSDDKVSPPSSSITFTVDKPTDIADIYGKRISLTQGQDVVVNVGSLNIKELGDIGLKMPDDYIQTSKGYDWSKTIGDLLGPILLVGFLLLLMGGGLVGGGYRKFKNDNQGVHFADAIS